MRYLPRPRELEAIRAKLRRAPITALLGPRQCGKTTLARALEAEHFFDLEEPRSLVRLDEAQTALEGLTGTVVIDEVQRKPDLFPLLRVLADRQPATRYLLLGSASPELVKEVSESLAGRVAYHDLGPLALDETGTPEWRSLWLRGGFPRSYLSDGDTDLRALAGRLHPQPPGTRHSRPRNLHPGGDPAAILGDGEPLPRPDAQPLRARPILRCLRSHGSPLPRHPERHFHDPPAASRGTQMSASDW